MSEIEALKAALLETVQNLNATDEIARHAATGLNAQTAHLTVIEAILVAMLRKHPVDLAPAKASILSAPPALQSPALSLLKAIEGRSKA